MTSINSQPITVDLFAPFGDVIDGAGHPTKMINQGRCARHSDLAQLDFSDGRAGISVFCSNHFSLPLALNMMERHPDGSQAFIPMSWDRFLVTVAPDEDGTPGRPLAFLTQPGQGVNLHRNVWHGVLTPLAAPGVFAVIDRIGEGANLEEHWFDTPYTVR